MREARAYGGLVGSTGGLGELGGISGICWGCIGGSGRPVGSSDCLGPGGFGGTGGASRVMGAWGWVGRIGEALSSHQTPLDPLDLPHNTAELPPIPQTAPRACFTGVHQSQEPE